MGGVRVKVADREAEVRVGEAVSAAIERARLAAFVFDHTLNCRHCGVTEFGDECLHPRAGRSRCSCQRSILRRDGLGPCPEEEALLAKMCAAKGTAR